MYICIARPIVRRLLRHSVARATALARETAVRVLRERKPVHHAAARLDWYLDKVRLVEPAPLGKPRSRNDRDDPYLAAALAAKARVLGTYDQDLLVLGKPFGVPIVRPARFLAMFHPG